MAAGVFSVPLTMYGAHNQWVDMPAGETGFLGATCRNRLRTHMYKRVALGLEVLAPGSASAVIRARYTTDLTAASGWTQLVTDQSIAATGTFLTADFDVPAAAKNREILVDIVGQSGDGAADPVIGRVVIWWS